MNFPLKSILSIFNLILNKVVYEFSIDDFVQGCPLQIFIFSVEALGDETQIHLDLGGKVTLKIHLIEIAD